MSAPVFLGEVKSSVLLLGLACVLIFTVVVIVPSPSQLSAIPGPRLARATRLWIWSQDMMGRAPKVIRQLHAEYGPIVRIGPNEVSINDAEVYNNVLYCQAPRFPKALSFYQVFSVPEPTLFSTSDTVAHGKYRRLLSNCFSRKEILAYESRVWETATTMSNVLTQTLEMRKPVEITRIFRSLTLDVISKFAYGESLGALRGQGFEIDLLQAFEMLQWTVYFKLCTPLLALFSLKAFKATPRLAQKVKEGLDNVQTQMQIEDNDFRPMLAMEIQNGIQNGVELTPGRLIADGIGVLAAGTDTTGITLALGTWAIFSNQQFYDRLHTELIGSWPEMEDHPSLLTLEKLPYLRACVKESLRFATAIPSRLPRTCPPSGWSYAGYTIPPGTSVSSSSYLLHHNKDVFPEPEAFVPDRWLVSDEKLKLCESYLMPFSRGSRSCIGQNLAVAEIYIALATMFRRFKCVSIVDKELETKQMFITMVPNGLRGGYWIMSTGSVS